KRRTCFRWGMPRSVTVILRLTRAGCNGTEAVTRCLRLLTSETRVPFAIPIHNKTAGLSSRAFLNYFILIGLHDLVRVYIRHAIRYATDYPAESQKPSMRRVRPGTPDGGRQVVRIVSLGEQHKVRGRTKPGERTAILVRWERVHGLVAITASITFRRER